MPNPIARTFDVDVSYGEISEFSIPDSSDVQRV